MFVELSFHFLAQQPPSRFRIEQRVHFAIHRILLYKRSPVYSLVFFADFHFMLNKSICLLWMICIPCPKQCHPPETSYFLPKRCKSLHRFSIWGLLRGQCEIYNAVAHYHLCSSCPYFQRCIKDWLCWRWICLSARMTSFTSSISLTAKSVFNVIMYHEESRFCLNNLLHTFMYACFCWVHILNLSCAKLSLYAHPHIQNSHTLASCKFLSNCRIYPEYKWSQLAV